MSKDIILQKLKEEKKKKKKEKESALQEKSPMLIANITN